MTRLTDAVVVSAGEDESATVTETGYVPAIEGVPDTCPPALSASPGGNLLGSVVQLKGATPPPEGVAQVVPPINLDP